jgi:16S rRNA processing protein RimM
MTPRIPEYITIGIIMSAVGLNGEIRVDPATDFPEERFKPGAIVYIDGVRHNVETYRLHKGQPVIKLADIADQTQATALSGQRLEIHRDQVKTSPEDGYYYFQLEGLEVWTVEGQLLGKITQILPTGSNDNFVVRDAAGGEILIPAIDEVVRTVDLEGGRLVIEPLPGLLELNRGQPPK